MYSHTTAPASNALKVDSLGSFNASSSSSLSLSEPGLDQFMVLGVNIGTHTHSLSMLPTEAWATASHVACAVCVVCVVCSVCGVRQPGSSNGVGVISRTVQTG